VPWRRPWPQPWPQAGLRLPPAACRLPAPSRARLARAAGPGRPHVRQAGRALVRPGLCLPSSNRAGGPEQRRCGAALARVHAGRPGAAVAACAARCWRRRCRRPRAAAGGGGLRGPGSAAPRRQQEQQQARPAW
jgi:hypothetical protein